MEDLKKSKLQSKFSTVSVFGERHNVQTFQGNSGIFQDKSSAATSFVLKKKLGVRKKIWELVISRCKLYTHLHSCIL